MSALIAAMLNKMPIIGHPETANDSPHVSVIIPSYNQARYVTYAIQSVLDQRIGDYEIIVVDDGSIDETRDVVSRFEGQIRYIYQENRGLGGARNTGIRAARGEFVGLLDADDQWLPDFMETMLSLATGHPEASIYYCYARSMDMEGRELPQLYGGPNMKSEILYQTLLRANFLIPSTIMMRRSIVLAAGLFEEADRAIHGCEDWDLWLRIAPKFDFVGTPACLVRYRIHENTFSANPAGMQRAVQAVVEKHFGPDDGHLLNWSHEKRRAYGGVYRYQTLTSIQRQNDWQTGARYLNLALRSDPTMAADVDLFKELALGSQAPGYRGTSQCLNLAANATHIDDMLGQVFSVVSTEVVAPLRRKTYGTAYYSLGLVAYSAGELPLSRSFLLRALVYRPDLWRDGRIISYLAKSLAGRKGLDWLRQLRK